MTTSQLAAVESHIYINLWTRLIYGFNIYSMAHVLRHQWCN